VEHHLVVIAKNRDKMASVKEVNTLCFEIDSNQHIVLLVLGNLLQDFINCGDFLPSELRIKQTSGIKAANVPCVRERRERTG